MDLDRGEVRYTDGARAQLTAKEQGLLSALLAARGGVVSRDQLLSEVWGSPPTLLTRAVDNAVMRLRAKVEADPAAPRHVLTVHGDGYRLVLDEAPPIDAALSRLRERLASARLLTLVGAAGVGKTHLARALVEGIPCRWVDLSGVTDEDGLLAALSPGRAEPKAIARALVEERLLVLDGCDRVLPALGVHLPPLLAALPELRVLASSRERLRLRGEQLAPVEPLEPEAAMAMLSEHLRALGQDPPSPPVLAEVIRRLDGVPLALELAAPRIALLGPEGWLRLGSSTLDALSEGPREAPTGGLRQALALSWGLLSPPQREALLALSVFRGPFSAESAALVLAGEDAARDLQELLERSLLRREPAGRFRLLALVRDFALEAGGPPAEALARHAACMADTGDLEDRADLLAAHHWALGAAPALACGIAERLWPVLSATGPAALLERLAEDTGALGTPRARLLRFEARLALGLERDPGELDPALAEPDLACRAALLLSRHHRLRGDPAEAERGFQLALAAGGAAEERALLSLELGIQAIDRHNPDEAAEHLARAARLAEPAGRLHTRVRLHQAMAASEAGLLARGLELIDESLGALEARGDRRGLGIALCHRALILVEDRRPAEAEAAASRARSLARQVGNQRFEAYAELLLGLAAYERGDRAAAESLALSARVGFEELNDRRFAALALARQAVAAAARGLDPRPALEAARLSLEEVGIPLLLTGMALLGGFGDLFAGDRAGARARLQGAPARLPGSFPRMARRHLEEALAE